MQRRQNASICFITLGILCYSSLLVSMCVCFSTQGRDKNLLVVRVKLTKQNFPFSLNPLLSSWWAWSQLLHKEPLVLSRRNVVNYHCRTLFEAAPLWEPDGPYCSWWTKTILIGSLASSVDLLFSCGWNADRKTFVVDVFRSPFTHKVLRLERDKEQKYSVR